MAEKLSFAEAQDRWREMCDEYRAKQAAVAAFNPFRQGWAASDRVVEWNELNDAVEAMRKRMDEFIAAN